MYSTKIYISDVITARRFVAVMERYPEVDLRIKIDNLEIDPHSVMGEDYPSETFRVLKDNEIAKYGEYRTQRLVLEAWDRMEFN